MAQFEDGRPDAAKGVARDWHDLYAGRSRVVWDEVGIVVQAPWPDGTAASRAEKQMRFAELCALVGEAERGELRGGGWRHVARWPDLWELRLRFEAGQGGLLVRGYFHEPLVRPRQTVLAKIHLKDVASRDDAVVDALQNAQIDEAHTRVVQGRVDEWGLGRSQRFLCTWENQ